MNPFGAPEAGEWYRNIDTDELFRVVGVDEASTSVQIQTFDGQIDSIDRDEWDELSLAAAAPPEDWTGPMDEMEDDDVTEDDSPSDRAAN